MAKQTDKGLRNKMMYQIFVRNFSREGSFQAVIPQLDRIKALGTDVIWFMPIHPIGEEQRKGTLGSPYAISDYRAINPEFGTLDDFKRIVDEIHKRGMKCIIDVVYNHTSPDSVLSKEHPEWFYHKPDGSFGNRVGDWSDIIDLDYSNRELWNYQIETLCYWAKIVDGFRCDVAPLIPLDFWLAARAEVEKVRPGCVWLSESVEPGFITYLRGRKMTALSDSEIYQVFDLSYDYDIFESFKAYIEGRGSLEAYAEAINRQEYTFSENYVKLRFLENHDQARARFLIPDIDVLKSLTAFMFFQKGMTLVYAGQEMALSHAPSLFDRDTVNWTAHEAVDISKFIAHLAEIKKSPVFTDSMYKVRAVKNTLVAVHESENGRLAGIFPTAKQTEYIPVDIEDGKYENLIDGSVVEVFRGGVQCFGKPIIIGKCNHIIIKNHK